MKCPMPAAFSSSMHAGAPATMNMARPANAWKAGTAYCAYSSSLEQSTTMSAFAFMAASMPSSTVAKPRLSMTSYPAHARKLHENWARAWRMARLPIVSMNAFGRFPECSVSRRSASNSLAARAVSNLANDASSSCGWSLPPHPHTCSNGALSPACSVKLGYWLVPNRISLRRDTASRRALLLWLTAFCTLSF